MSQITLELHRYQTIPFHWLFTPEGAGGMRFAVVVASRGFGKSYLGASTALNAAIQLERLPINVLNKNVALIAATHEQAEKVYFPLLNYEFGLGDVCKVRKKPSLQWEFPNRTIINVWSADAYERLRGSGIHTAICDEISTWKVPGSNIGDAWESVIEPCILSRWAPNNAEDVGAFLPGRALIISTVKGRDFLYDLSLREEQDERWKTFTYNYKQSPYLSVEEIEKSRKNYDPIKFAREYECSFEESGLQVFHQFDRRVHVRTVEDFQPNETIHAAIDFNIKLNATSFSAIRGNKVFILDEYRGASNTSELVKAIKAKYPGRQIICYPDPSGNTGSTKAPVGQTDFTILREAGFQIRARGKSPSVVDSSAAVNRHLLNAAGETNLWIHPRCSQLIKSLERTIWNERVVDSAVIDKSAGVEHFSDGVRYMIDYLFPLKGRPAVARNFMF